MSDGVSPVLPTFCHVSELGALGYGNLHRMLAMSRPLNLWAPSSVLLRDPGCRVTPGTSSGTSAMAASGSLPGGSG